MRMKVSASGLFRNTARALQSSKDDMACVLAYSLGEMLDNLRLVKDGRATVDEFFQLYVFDANDTASLAGSVKKERFDCMQDEELDIDEDAA